MEKLDPKNKGGKECKLNSKEATNYISLLFGSFLNNPITCATLCMSTLEISPFVHSQESVVRICSFLDPECNRETAKTHQIRLHHPCLALHLRTFKINFGRIPRPYKSLEKRLPFHQFSKNLQVWGTEDIVHPSRCRLILTL